jgi:subtilisin family serine protease
MIPSSRNRPHLARRVAIAAVSLLGLLILAGGGLRATQTLDGDVSGFMPVAVDEAQRSSSGSGTMALGGNRIMVVLRTPVTPEILEMLGAYGRIHGWVESLQMVGMTPAGTQARAAIRALPYVQSIEPDALRYLTDIATWDRDMLDVSDVEETGPVGDPDPREVAETGAGVHVAVIDTGLISNWRDFLADTRVDTSLARSVMGGGSAADDGVPANQFNTSSPENHWEKDTNSHGTAVASHIIGFRISGRLVDGTAPRATIIPIKVFPNGEAFTFASRLIGAFDYVTSLKQSGRIGPTVISMSISGGTPTRLEEIAINRAIAAGIVVVTSAGNRGERGMGWPAAYPQVISVGAVGWTKQFRPGTPTSPNFGFWWNANLGFDPDPAGPPAEESEAFVAGFSSRAIPSRNQQLDVLAPGQWTVAPGNHGPNAAYFFWSGTSFSTPLTAGVAALLLERGPSLNQGQVESILKSTALPMLPVDSRSNVLSGFDGLVGTISWDTDCNGVVCDPVGAGLVQADAALAAVP